jgi:hypothetical protein
VIEPSELQDFLTAADTWAACLRPVAEHLGESGIILFLYPMGHYYTDLFESDLSEYIRGNAQILKYYERFTETKIDTSGRYFAAFDELNWISYLAVSGKSNSIYLKHNLDRQARELVYTVLKKSGLKFKWNKSSAQPITITQRGKAQPKVETLTEVLANGLNRLLKSTFKIRRNGEKTSNPSALQFDVSAKALREIMDDIGFREVGWLSALSPHGEEYFIAGKMLYVNFSDSMPGDIYSRLKS